MFSRHDRIQQCCHAGGNVGIYCTLTSSRVYNRASKRYGSCFPMPRPSPHPAVSTPWPASDTGVVFQCQDPPHIQPCLQQGQLAIRELFSDAKTLLTSSRPASDTGVVFRCQDPPHIQPCLQQGQLAIRELFSDAKTLLTSSRVYNRAS
ncbi:hypothetical protein J6590_097575 [Homalodisca vitripennis]|nr:hypothetical protein J6590_097575 [Homalodisca vitripennis]